MKNFYQNKKGIALAISMMVVAMVVILSAMYISKAIFEKAMADREIRSAKAFYASEGGSNAGLNQLDSLINTSLLQTVNATSPAVIASQAANYVSTNNALGFLVAYTRNGATSLLTQSGSQAVYNGGSTSINTTSNYGYNIVITPKGNPVTVAPNTWDFPYYFQIQSTGSDGSQSKKTSINGDFTVRVRKDNFARYALFTNNQTMPNGSNVWFTNSTNFSGPMYTNGRYNFAYNPSGNFYGLVQQEDSQARFYNNGSSVSLSNDHNGTIDVPTFHESLQRSATAITMPSTSLESTMAAEASAGNTYGSNGIYVPTSSGAVSGGIYVKGDATITMSVDGSDRAVYTIVQGGTTKTITVDRTNNQTIVAGSTTNTYTGKPDGVDHVGTIIYVNGNITSLGGTVQKDTQMLIASHNDVVIQNHVRYAQYTPATGTPGSAGYVAPSSEGYNNLLGIMSWAGDVRIGTSAPNNIDIHATIMAQQGIVTVDNYDSTAVRGTATILGGVISDYYGGFGTFNSSSGTAVSGYGRNFVYDTRMETEFIPPYFPTLNTFIAFSNDINDKKFSQTGGF